MFHFGEFRLIPERRVLLEAELPVALGGRAFDILALLLERAGEVVGKDELIARAWPRTVVEEANLRVHVSALRKALRDGHERRFIENVAGRGYSFVAPVAVALSADDTDTPSALVPEAPPRSLPLALNRIIGRAGAVAGIARCLGEQRLVSIVGPGGIGKTTVALAVANQLQDSYGDRACLADLGQASNAAMLPAVIASALRLPVLSEHALASVATHLRERHLLLVLDNCEHLVDAVAGLAEQLLDGAPRLRILATSRESLRASMEWVYRLPSLEVPAADTPLCPASLPDYAALELFAERAAGALDLRSLGPDELALAGDICRRLDGIPLAIELAAARVDLLGIRGLAEGLDDCFAMLTRNRRTALPRHQTLRAVLDWSFELLSPAEQQVLQRLAVFRAAFTLDSACAVAANPDAAAHGAGTLDAGTVLDCVFNLAAKSLLAADADGDTVLYRLLETTRTYAAAKLADSGGHRDVERRHALDCCTLVAQAEDDWDTLPGAAWQARYRRRVADLRHALCWAFGADGDSALGVRLMTASTRLWIELSLLDEQRHWLLRALPEAAAADELRLQAALGNALFHLNGAHREAIAAFARAYRLAAEFGDVLLQARTYSGLCANYLLDGDYPAALELGRSFAPLAEQSGSPVARLIVDRMMSLTHHFCGDQPRARVHAERVYAAPLTAQRNTRNSGVQYDERVAAATVLSRIRWLEGFPEQALALAQEGVARALAIEHPISLCYCLAVGACPVAFWVGARDTAAGYVALLAERAARHALAQWQSWGRHYAWVGTDSALGAAAGLRLPPGPQAEMLATLLPHLVGTPEIARAEQGLAGWCAPELLRLKGELMLRDGAPAAAVEAAYRASLELAERQRALAWVLRTSTSLARLWAGRGRTAEARVMLGAACARFTEGFGTPDLRAAHGLLAALAPAR